jgi:hypothetical protein
MTYKDTVSTSSLSQGIDITQVASLYNIPTIQGIYQLPDGSMYYVSLSGMVSKLAVGSGIGGSGLKKLLVFGNSIAGQSSQRLEPAAGKAIFTGNQLAGANVLTITPDLSADATVVAGSKIALNLYCDTVFTTTLASKGIGTLTVNDKIPRLSVYGRSVTTYTGNRPSSIRTLLGAVGLWNALNGGAMELLPSYTYSGAFSRDMLVDFYDHLNFHKPDYCVLHLFENDIPSGVTYATMQRNLQAYLNIANSFGVVCIVVGCYPANGINTPTLSGYYDQINAYITSNLPGPHIGVDPGALWLDKAVTTARQPLTGWTDGVHPNTNRWLTIAKQFKSLLSGKLSVTAPAKSAIAIDYYQPTGTGGTLNGGSATAVGTLAAGATLTLYRGGTSGSVMTCSKDADDNQVLNYTTTGACINGSDLFAIDLGAKTIPVNFGGQCIKVFMELFVTNLSLCANFWLQIDFSSGESYSSGQTNIMDDTAAVNLNNVLSLASPSVFIPEGATTYKAILNCWPGSVSGVAANFKVLSFGLLPASSGEIGQSFKPLK